MKKIKFILLAFAAMACASCSDFLEVKPKDKISADVIFSSQEGIKLYMASLYYQLPIEDFNFTPDFGFYTSLQRPGGPNNSMNSVINAAMYTEEGIHSSWERFTNDSNYNWWEDGYKLIRDVNVVLDAVPTLNISQKMKDELIGEASFIRGYAYFALARRYGGLPLIDAVQEYNGDAEALKVARSTEKQTWDFVLADLDVAAENLPATRDADNRRATKWSALALKSRAALHAASVAKYWNQAPLSGEAVDAKLVGGMTDADAKDYYMQCIKAAKAIMDSGVFSLYKPEPKDAAEATANYQALFETPGVAECENIFVKGYGMINDRTTSHNYDIWYGPNQMRGAWPNPGRFNPTLDMVDEYESYDHPGGPCPVVTTTDGNVTDVNGFNASTDYLRFSDPKDVFSGKDARFFACINYPFTTWKGQKIIIQAGLIKADGTPMIETNASYLAPDGNTYYTYGAADMATVSGFHTDAARYTRTGFLLRKFLQEKQTVTAAWFNGTTDWIDMRYAEVLLDYAEAVVECDYAEGRTTAAEALNSIRRRAGHTTDVPLTLANVLHERKVELAFENKRPWDLIRRREYHKEFNNKVREALYPILDFRTTPAQYIFVRKAIRNEAPKTFNEKLYYKPIPGIASNGLVQNPQY